MKLIQRLSDREPKLLQAAKEQNERCFIRYYHEIKLLLELYNEQYNAHMEIYDLYEPDDLDILVSYYNSIAKQNDDVIKIRELLRQVLTNECFIEAYIDGKFIIVKAGITGSKKEIIKTYILNHHRPEFLVKNFLYSWYKNICHFTDEFIERNIL